MQEKYDLYVKKSEEKINKLVSESVHRAQINASPEIRKYVNESLSSRDKKEKNLTGIASNKNQNSRHIKGNILNLNSTIEFNKTIEDQKQHIEYLNETYTVQLDKLSQELADIRESYRSLEIELLKTQENLKNSEENRIISIKSSEHLINEHKQEIKIIKDTLEKEQINLSHLKNENLKLKTEILENSQLEILKKYTKVVLELKNKSNLHQEEVLAYKQTIKEQADLISSLKDETSSHNSYGSINQNGEVSPSKLKNRYSGDYSNINTSKKENIIINDLRDKVNSLTSNYELNLRELLKYKELYANCQQDCNELKQALEDLSMN